MPYVSVFLEDDIDLESDIQERLASLWDYLPEDWDIATVGQTKRSTHRSALPLPQHRRTNGPLCTHAYALSPKGLQRLTQDLAHPSFAYSRPIDTVFKYLLQNGRLKSYSVIPGVPVQRKDDMSDVSNRTYAPSPHERYEWDRLYHGALANADRKKCFLVI
ncbi:hypothetical protein FB45DRAFT_1039774 [Roridomyces roridus]|uniref:Glycosyltransferase family 25 protein n=1 Tax=Roridomyces roridus TaxID=1738132 RepID=A0AAD7B3E3_9AGAR|nr:hypothetical protein FB45DRAFT_1039774 [Roridomyces roridus]